METTRPSTTSRLLTLTAALLILPAALTVSGCGESGGGGVSAADTMRVETRADSIAMRAYEALGGPNAWASMPYLRFDFASGNDTSRTLRASHLWDRTTGDYRVEIPAGRDSMYVVLFNVESRDGDVYLNGEQVEGSDEERMLQQAYTRFINDTYWLLMPVKMMDPGVTRTYIPDSSQGDMDVVQLSFDNVGLTPGDQYWVYVDRNTGRVESWAFRLQGHPRDHVPQPIRWTGYRSFQTPEGPVEVSERKTRNGSVTYTDNVEVPETLPEGAFTDPNPILQES